MSEDTALEKLLDLAAPKLTPATELEHTFNKLVNEKLRRIYLGAIDESSAEWFNIALDYFNGLSSEPINITLNSPGGNVVSMFAIHDAIRASNSPIHILGTGEVASAAVLLLACAHKRMVTQSCCLMSHAGSIDIVELDYRAAKDRRVFDDWQQSEWCVLMGRYTPGKDDKWWAKETAKKAESWFLGGKAIVEAGLADEVV